MGQQTTYQYDQSGRLTRKTDPQGQTNDYTYDNTGRMIQIYQTDINSNHKTINFTYDNAGNLLTYNDGTTNAAYTYDDLYRKTQETTNYGTFNLTTNYSYNSNGTKKTFTYPNSTTIEYSYDSNNQIAGINIPNTGYITYGQYQWTRPTSITLPGGSIKQYNYDALMRTQTITTNDPGQNNQMNYAYTYDKMDNIKTKNTEAGNYNYNYDELYRLNEVKKDQSQTEVYTYDEVGNRITAKDTTGNWTYDNNNELLSLPGLTGQSSPTSYTYDQNGNTIQRNNNGQITNFVYNAENRLIQVKDGNGAVIATYTYDPFGRRIKKTVSPSGGGGGEVVTYYLYSDEGLIGEYDSTGTEIKTYGYKPNSTWTTDPVFMKQGTDYYFYHNDHLGTPQKMTDISGAIVWQATYDAFGKATVDSSSSVTNNLRFPGQYYDSETGLHYNYNRFYEPETGRYLRKDPIGFRANDVNLYRYVRSNPTRWSDPFGLFGEGGPGSQYKGHRDFTGGDDFDYYAEDRDKDTGPFSDPERHFRDLPISEQQVEEAITKCNRSDFERAMHRGQDYFSHFKKGYRWMPFQVWKNLGLGHLFDGTAPDEDPAAWQEAEEWTIQRYNRWKLECPCADQIL